MRSRRITLAAATSLIAGSLSSLALSAVPAAAAGTSVALPVSSYAHMLVDPAHQRLFFSGGPGSTSLLSTDLSGGDPRTIPDQPGADGLALSADGSTLYVALSGGDAISAVDPVTLTETGRFDTGSGSAPVSVATAGTRVWYGYTAGASQGGIGSVDLSAPVPAAEPQPGMGSWDRAPLLTAKGQVLAAETPSGNTVHAATFRLTSSGATPQADFGLNAGAGEFALTPDGSTLLTAGTTAAALRAFRTSDLNFAQPSVYFTGQGPDAVSVSPDGTVATGNGGASGNDVFVYAPGDNLAMNTFDLGSQRLAPDGLMWGADGVGLYAVVGDSTSGYGLLRLDEAGLAATQLSASVAYGYAAPTLPYTVSGKVTAQSAFPGGEVVHVTEDGADLPDAPLAADGSFGFDDLHGTAGHHDYRISYDGDRSHRASTTSLGVDVAPMTTSVWAQPTSVDAGSVVLSGTVTVQGRRAAFPDGMTVDVTRVDEDTRQSTRLASVPVTPQDDLHAAFTVTDAPGTPGRYTYTVSFAGTSWLTAGSDDVSLFVPYTPTLTLTDPPHTGGVDKQLTFSGRLTGTPPADDEPYGVPQLTVIDDSPYTGAQYTVAVQPDGTFTFPTAPNSRGTHTYTFSYGGSSEVVAAEATAVVDVAGLVTPLSVTTDAPGYANGSRATVTAHLGAAFTGGTVTFYATPAKGAKTQIGTATVDSRGNAVLVSPRLTKDTTFTASYAGDVRYAPATATRTVQVHG
ncbi:YncE family protein [Streptomyces sp. NPDC049040]|uniref:YncE family protein n=1 Tax=Streptomyces sp. NPDC049040 TaxID=3365593 RepID=UPI00370FC050